MAEVVLRTGAGAHQPQPKKIRRGDEGSDKSPTPKPRKPSRIKEIEERIRTTPGKLVKIEKKIVDFPFQKYFVGQQKSEPAPHKPRWREWKNDRLTMAWLGHSTVLINFFGTWIITDPVFSIKVGIDVGLMTIGPRRLVEPPLDPKDLPRIDLMLISHAHMDHTDIPSLKKLRSARHTVIAANTSSVYDGLKLIDLKELDWGQTLTYSDLGGLTVEAIGVKHAGWRMPWHPCRSRNETNGFSYNAYLIEKVDENGDVRSFIFGGDTGYTQRFREVGDRLRAEGREVDVALMPIGAYNPWQLAHCTPEQSWAMTQDANARMMLPIHWNTYVQSAEPRFEPIEWLRSIVPADRIALSEHGETWSTD